MSPALRLGPLVFPIELALLAAAVVIGLIAGRLLAGACAEDASRVLWRGLLLGLLVARLAFVWQYRDHFLQNPLKILDLRDGGWAGLAGLAAALLYGAYAVLRDRAPRRAVLVAMALGAAVWLGGGRLLAPSAQPQPQLAALSLQQLDGAPATLAAFHGKPMVVNLWASWCPPCRREMPAFEQAQAANPDIHFVFLNQGEAAAAVRQYLDEHAPSLANALLDPAGDASRQMSNRGLPATLFLDAQGRLLDVRVGELSSATLAQRLESIRADGAQR
ncbi:TlpA family protein disulfide reductase [Achromobacter insuavis]|uniref:TlpA family protein disulfide reductase n=1 Tax=Achromobacter insuavis TaxID=1287735 RepID=UPI0029D96819|nr:TlpA family protein disulfide reductase [Achromobacter sp.]MCG2606719.1 TlpA family protein disulfide reductase [Achromobacter sp.]